MRLRPLSGPGRPSTATPGTGLRLGQSGRQWKRSRISRPGCRSSISAPGFRTCTYSLTTHGGGSSRAKHALDLITRVLLAPGDCVAFEEPGYGPARRVFQAYGARIVTVPVDAEGLVVRDLPADARLVYTTPSHQFPLGVVMSPRRRADLLAWAARHHTIIVEDDYDSEFRYSGRPIEPVHALDQAGLVLYVASFSKMMLPVLRIGFLVTPPHCAATCGSPGK
jgi:GntR family transcriptional regulator / MocR family aminotransferase